jgi:CRP/FNR family transcriptional regulator, cyclic AMP receptor protein
MNAVNRSELLAKVPLLRGLPPQRRASLGERLVERRFGADQPIFSKGDPGSSMFIVLEGAVELFVPPAPSAERLSLKVVRTGEHFGELALLDDKSRSASASARAPSVLLELSREDFVEHILSSPHAVMAVLGEMADRLRETTQLLTERVSRDVVKDFDESLTWAQRLADRVAELNGSWTFILSLVVLTGAWALLNRWLRPPFDGYPYVFFNLLLGLLVALQGPLIMMSQNRQAQKDRAQAASDFRVNLKNELGIEGLARDLLVFRRETEERLANLEHSLHPLLIGKKRDHASG